MSASPQVSLQSRVSDQLRALRSSTPDILGAVVINMDGFVIASVIPSDVDEDLIAGMGASLLGVSERISADLMGDETEQVFIRSPKGYIVMSAITQDASVILLVSRDAKLGLIFLELKRAVAELGRLL